MSSFSSIFLIVAIIVAFMAVAQCRNLQFEVDEMAPEAAYRFAPWGDIPHKRVPSAGDMMVRFGKRSI